MNIRDVGWVWEGQGLNSPGVVPSIFGIGDGCRYFGLSRAWYMFHPNDELAMNKLSWLDEVVCDITKWIFCDIEVPGIANAWDNLPASVQREAALVGDLSTRFPNITGAVHDDMWHIVNQEDFTPDQYAEVYTALKNANPDLKLWTVVYDYELGPDDWAGFEQFMDVISLWVWKSENLVNLDEYIARCRDKFPDKPLIMGCYLREYELARGVPMEMLKLQWETLLRHLEAGTVDGYSILGMTEISLHQEQANWIRDFIAANS